MLIDPFVGHPHRRRAWGEGLLVAASAPFLLFPTQFILGTLLACLLVALLWLWPLPAPGRRRWLPPTPLNGALLLFGLMLGVSILVTADPDLTLPKAAGLLLGLTTWRYLAWVCQTERALTAAAWGFALLALAFTAIGMVSANWYVKVPFLAALLPSRLLALPEADSVGVHANQLAATILLYFPLSASLLLGQWWRNGWRGWQTLALLLATAVSGGLLLLTQSRSGWIGGMGGLFILLALWGRALPASRRRRLLRLLLGLALLVILLGLAALGPARLATLWQDPVLETAVGNLGTITFRSEVWRWGILAVSDFPFTGTGLGSFRQVIHRFYPTTIAPTYDIAHAHNIFLQVALDVGLPGLVAYGALLLLAGYMGWQAARRSDYWRPVALGLLAGLSALHIFGLTDALALGAKPGLLFWWTLGLLTALHGQMKREA